MTPQVKGGLLFAWLDDSPNAAAEAAQKEVSGGRPAPPTPFVVSIVAQVRQLWRNCDLRLFPGPGWREELLLALCLAAEDVVRHALASAIVRLDGGNTPGSSTPSSTATRDLFTRIHCQPLRSHWRAPCCQIPMPKTMEEDPSPFMFTEVPIDMPMWLEQVRAWGKPFVFGVMHV